MAGLYAPPPPGRRFVRCAVRRSLPEGTVEELRTTRRLSGAVRCSNECGALWEKADPALSGATDA
jgi:hypothetical protein